MNKKENKETSNKKYGIWIALAIVVALVIMVNSLPENSNTDVEYTRNSNNINTSYVQSEPELIPLSTSEQAGYKISVLDYKFEQRGDDWGAITEIEVEIENTQGSDVIFPDLLLVMESSSQKRIDKMVEMGDILYPNQKLRERIKTDFSFSKSNEIKDFKVQLIERYSAVLVSTQFKTNVSEFQ